MGIKEKKIIKYPCVMKHRHLMQETGGLIPILSLRSTHVTIVQSTTETGDINGLKHGWKRLLSCLVITTAVYGAWNVWGGKLLKQNQK